MSPSPMPPPIFDQSADTIQVTVLDTITGDQELLTLTETGTNTGVFRNITGLPTSATSGLYPNDGILNGSPGIR